MPYLNSRLCALLAMGLSLVAVPGLRAQDASSTAAPAVIRGDVNGDGRVTRADADAVRTWLVRGTLPDGRSILPAGDANGDGRVTAADAALISRFAAGVDVSRFPVGRPVGAGGERMSGSALVATEYECRVEFRAGPLNCSVVSPTGSNGARLDLMLYKEAAKVVGNGAYSGGNKSNPDTMAYSLAVRNLITQPIGTTDGSTPDTSRLVITSIRLTSPQTTATSQVTNADGTATFVDSLRSAPDTTYTDVPYINYPGLIAPNTNSAADSLYIVFSPSVTAMTFTYRIWTRVQYLHGYATIAPADSVIGAGQTLTLTASAFSVLGAPLAGETFTWSSPDPTVQVNASTGGVTGVQGGMATVTATSNADSRRTGTRVITVIEPVTDSYPVTGNVRLTSTSSVLSNDTIRPAVTISFAGWNNVEGTTLQGGNVVMDTTGAGMGTFTYNPPAGFEGVDSLEYRIKLGSAISTGKVALQVSGMLWFVTNDADGCTTRASANGCGRLTRPYSSLAAFNVENNGTGNNPAAGDAIFLYEGTHAGGVTLLAQQKLIGQDAGASLSAVSGITPAAGSDALPSMDAGGATTTVSGGVVLANIGSSSGPNNTVRGLTIATNGATALSGTSFGTLVIKEVPLSAENGQVLRLDGGTLSETFPSVTSTGSPRQGISLRNISGTLTVTAGSIADADSAAFLVSGGDVAATWPGNITQANNAPLLDVASHTGTLLFQTGTLNATNGTGLQFNSAQGTYTFSGTTTLAGGDAAVDITNGSAGTFNFGTGTSITNPSGTAFYVYGSAPALVSYSGNITKNAASAGRLVEIGEMTGGTVTFATGTLSATSSAGTGISLSNADGIVNFNGTTTLTGGDNGVDVLAASAGTIAFAAGTSITNPSGTAFNVNSSTPNLTFSGSITKDGTSAGRLVDVTGQTGGSLAANNTITFQTGTLSSTSTTGTGILLSNVDGTVNFNGTTTLNGGDAGIDVENGTGGVVAFANTASVTNSTAELIRVVSSAPTFTYQGSFSRTSGTGAGILVQNNTGGTITFNGNPATETAAISSGASAAVSLLGNTGTTINFTTGNLDIDVTSGAGFAATGGGTVNVTGAANTVNATGGGTAVNIQNTTIGGGGVTFYSVSASGGGSNGIVLASTGTGAFQVTGDGASDAANTTRGRTTAKSGGGTVGTTSGGTISGRGGDGINLSSTGAVTLRNMAVQNNSGDGIEASGVSGLTLDNLLVSGHANNRGVYASAVSGFSLQHSEVGSNGTSGSAGSSDLWNTDLVNGTGTASVTNSNLHTTAEFGLHVLNTSGTLSLSVSNTTVNGVTNGIGVGVYPQGTSNVTANFQGNTISNHSARGLQVGSGASSSAVTNLTVNNTQFVNNFVAIDAAHGSGGTFTFSITGNNLQTNVASSAQAININRLGSPSFGSFGLYSGTISGNTIGTAGVANSGSDVGDGINVESNGSGGITRVAVLNNTIREVGQRGIYLAAVDTDIGGGAAPTLEARVQNNNISNFEATALHGIQALLGALNTDNPVICLNISANTVVNAPNHGIRVRTSGLPSSTPTLRLHGWDGVTAPATYFANLNPAATGALANTNYSLGGGTVSSATCTTP